MADDKIRDALKMMPYGFYAFTTKSGGDINAMVVNWVSQMSYQPRLLAIGIQKSCYSHSLLESSQLFGLNLFLQADKEAIMSVTKGRAKNPNKMKEARYSIAPQTGLPILDGAAAYIECQLKQIIDIGGDHSIVIGEAINADVMKDAKPPDMLSLTHLGWSYAG